MQGLPARRVDLPGGSPLIVVTEVLLATPPLSPSADTALAHLLGIPSFGQAARTAAGQAGPGPPCPAWSSGPASGRAIIRHGVLHGEAG